MDEYDALLEEYEEQGQYPVMDMKKGMLNQPSLISISSVNGEYEAGNPTAYSDVGYYSFRVNLPRPALDVDTLQLLSSNIPQSNANIPDTACVFWYYRLSGYSGLVPNPNNLFMVRLLPSWYKKEFIDTPTNYGYNRTFKKYSDVATELVQSCADDLAWNNYLQFLDFFGTPTQDYRIPFLPADVSITYSSAINKFQFTGNPTTPVFVYYEALAYALGDIVAKAVGTNPVYQSLVSENTTEPPNSSWKRLWNTEAVAKYDYDTMYPAGRYVSYNNALYQSNYQTLQFLPSGAIATWNGAQQYYRGSVVELSGILYSSLGININSRPDVAGWISLTWSNTQLYATGMVVIYLGNYYVALKDGSGHSTSDTSYWFQIGTNFWTATTLPNTSIGVPSAYNYLATGYNDPNVATTQSTGNQIWNAYNLYEGGVNNNPQIVQYAGRTWVNGNQSQNDAPFNIDGATITSAVGSATTTLVNNVSTILSGVATYQTPSFNYYTAGQLVQISGMSPSTFNGTFRIVNQTLTSFSVVNTAVGSSSAGGTSAYPTYSGIVQYITNDVVLFTGFYFCATSSNVGINPNPVFTSWRQNNWTITADPSPITGLSQISSRFDFNSIHTITGAGQELYIPFPKGIPSQPYNNSPKRLLNSILGFSFNGQINPTLYANINQPIILTTSPANAPAYNRLRPVPLYLVGVPITGGSYDDSLTSYTYTADGYCNLVYSSIISIYTNIAGASTLDTQRDTNLLALVSMNCGNLGVSYWNNFIDNPLTKVQGSIYSIYIELRDEYGEPYYLTNNAVSTFVFKASYKD